MLLQLLSDTEDRHSAPKSANHDLVQAKTTELGQLLLHLQCTPVHQRPSQAAAMQHRIFGIVRDIAGMQCGTTCEQPTADQNSKKEDSEGRIDLDTYEWMDDDSLRMGDAFPILCEQLNDEVNQHFLKQESTATKQVCNQRLRHVPAQIELSA